MTVPLMALALLSLGGGFINVPKWLEPIFPVAEKPEDTMLMGISVAAAVIGIGLAYFLYVMRPGSADSLSASFGGLYKLVYSKYFVDEIYDAAVVQPTVSVSRAVLWRGVDVASIDGLVNGIATVASWIGGAAVEQFVGADIAIGAVDGLPAEIYGRLRQVFCQAFHPSSEIG